MKEKITVVIYDGIVYGVYSTNPGTTDVEIIDLDYHSKAGDFLPNLKLPEPTPYRTTRLMGFDELVDSLPKSRHDKYWTDGSVIFCETEENADALKDWLSKWCLDCLEKGSVPAKTIGEPYEEGGLCCPWNIFLI